MKIYIAEYMHRAAMDLLHSRAEVVDNLDNPEELDGAIVRVALFPKEIVEKTVNLKVIGKHGIGYDNIDVKAAKSRGIRVVYTPTANANSVAELIVSLFLACKRCVVTADALVRKSAYKNPGPKELTGYEIAGTTIGLVGVGKIACIVARIMRDGFGCQVLGYDPFITEEKAREIGIEKVTDLDDLLQRADCVNTSVPLTDSTRNMIDAPQLARMKPTAVLVNAARGGIVNEQALYNALKEKRLFAAACDAFVSEPPTADNPLTTLDNFIATPHIGANTDEALFRIGTGVVEDVLRVLDGQEPLFPVV